MFSKTQMLQTFYVATNTIYSYICPVIVVLFVLIKCKDVLIPLLGSVLKKVSCNIIF